MELNFNEAQLVDIQLKQQNFQLLSCFLCFQYRSSINILDTKNLQLNYILNNFGKQIYQHKRYLTLTFFVELFFTLKFSCEVLSLHLAVGLYCSLSLSLSLSLSFNYCLNLLIPQPN